MDVIYLDHNSTTPIPEEVLNDLAALASRTFGNPSSPHVIGRQSRQLLREATQVIADFVECTTDEVFFTSGASEANSWILHSIAEKSARSGRRPRFLLSSIEHDSTNAAAALLGAEVVFLRTEPSGCLDLQDLHSKLHEQSHWDLFSLVHANNETGVVQPVTAAISAARAQGVPIHLDCAQTLARLPIQARRLGADYLTFSGHKIGAPRGVGFVVATRSRLAPLIHGKQQQGLRGGTENVLGIAALARVMKLISSGKEAFPVHLQGWHRSFEKRVHQCIAGAVIHGEDSPRLRNTSFIGFDGIKSDSILIGLDLAGICVSRGSACNSGSPAPSHVLKAMGCSEAMARSSVRFSSGRSTTWQDFERVLDVLPGLVTNVRKGSP